MPNRLIEVVDEASIGPAQLPPRTFFYSLPPIGIGTWAIESTPGYISRLAASHRINVMDLVAIALGAKRASNGGWQLLSTYKQAARLNGAGLVASKWTARMAELTGQQILHTTGLGRLHKTFSHGRLLRYGRAWCPQCLDDMRRGGQVYEQMLWSLRHVTACFVHHIRLSAACHSCGRNNMSPLCNTHVVGYCSFCGEWLGNPEPEEATASSEWEMWVSSQLGGLIGSVSLQERDPNVVTMRGNLQALVQALGDGYMMRFAKKLGAQKSTCSTWLTGTTLPSIDYWLRMAWVSGVGIDRLILSSVAPEDVLGTSRDTGCIPPWGPRPSRRKHDWVLVERRLTEIARMNKTPPWTVGRLAKELGVDRDEIRAHLPKLYRALSQRSIQYQLRRQAQREKTEKEAMEIAVATLIKRGCTPTRRRVACELRIPAGDFRDARRTLIWQSCVAKLHLEY